MSVDLILFLALALVSVGAALGLLFSRNAVYAALFLVLNFITVAVFYLLLNAPFLAMAQVTVYAGAIMVLFLFVIMLLGTKKLKTRADNLWQRRLAIGLGVVLLTEIVALFLTTGPANFEAAIHRTGACFFMMGDLMMSAIVVRLPMLIFPFLSLI